MDHASLLPSLEKNDIHPDSTDERPPNSRVQGWLRKNALLLHFIMTLVYVAIYFNKSWTFASSHGHDHLNAATLFQVPLMTEPKIFRTIHNNPFAGPPNASIDEAWHSLLEPISVRVSKEEWQRTQRTSVELPEGGGYLGWVGVYHELHCLVEWNHCVVK